MKVSISSSYIYRSQKVNLTLFSERKTLFIIVQTYLINIFLRIVKSQCSPFSTIKKNKTHTSVLLSQVFSKEISQNIGGVTMREYAKFH